MRSARARMTHRMATVRQLWPSRPRCVVLSALVLAGLTLPASSALGAVSATGKVTSSGTSAAIEVDNTGDQTLSCMRYFVASGVSIVSVDPPATQEGSTALAAMTLIPPGGSKTFTFKTDKQIPANASGTLNVSATCASGSDVSAPVTGPPATPTPTPVTPPPTTTPCLCSDLTASLGEPTIHALHGRSFSINVHWTMTCTLGAGGCTGAIKLETFPKDIKILSPASKTIQCAAPTCAATTTGQMAIKWQFTKKERPLANAPVSKLRKHKKPYPSVNVRLSLFCVDATGKETLVHRPVLTIRFDRYGQVDKRHSILR
jgi:hypothetical protein